MIRQRHVSKTLYGYEIAADVTALDEGIHVLLYGGEKSHIGAVTIVGPGGQVNTTAFDGHKDGYAQPEMGAGHRAQKRTSCDRIRRYSL